jgi:hypothetical protein
LLRAVTGAVKDFRSDEFVGHGDEVLPGRVPRLAPALCDIDGRGELIVVLACPQGEGKADLLLVVQARGALRLGLGLRQCRQQQRGQNGDDGNDD